MTLVSMNALMTARPLRPRMSALALALTLTLALLALGTPTLRAADPLDRLVTVVAGTNETAVRIDILKGIRDALAGRRSVSMPAGWAEVEPQLLTSSSAELRALARNLGLTFGSPAALDALRATVADRSLDAATRQAALTALLGTRDAALPNLLRQSLDDPALRGAALRGLAVFDDPETAPAILGRYADLAGSEKRDALNTLSSRPGPAQALLAAVESGTVSSRDLTADVVRQLRGLRDDSVQRALTRVYGAVRDITADKASEIERYRQLYWAGGSQPGDAVRGRAVYARICQQCHVLYGVGSTVGPDLTGANRGDLDYLLQNILDPNAVIPNEYQATMIDLKDGRVLTGVVREQTANALVLATANEVLTLPLDDIEERALSQLSMMPEGLLQPLADQEYRDLIYYLTRPGQVPMLGTPETAGLFFNQQDLSLWHGNEQLWSVENGEIVGRTTTGLKNNEFLRSDLLLGDFRLTFEVKLIPNSENSGVQFRSEPLPDGDVKGYQADIGAGWWGKLYEEHGRGLLWDRPGDGHVRVGDWNRYEILAVGSQVRTTLNGQLCVDLDDPTGARRGIIALQLHSGGPMEIRFRNFQLEIDPPVN